MLSTPRTTAVTAAAASSCHYHRAVAPCSFGRFCYLGSIVLILQKKKQAQNRTVSCPGACSGYVVELGPEPTFLWHSGSPTSSELNCALELLGGACSSFGVGGSAVTWQTQICLPVASSAPFNRAFSCHTSAPEEGVMVTRTQRNHESQRLGTIELSSSVDTMEVTYSLEQNYFSGKALF